MSGELRAELTEFGKQVAISIGLLILAFLLSEDKSLGTAFVIACIPYGWRVLNRITPNIFVWMPFVGWLIYFGCKACLSAMIGMFVMPFIWIRCIIRVVNAYANQA